MAPYTSAPVTTPCPGDQKIELYNQRLKGLIIGRLEGSLGATCPAFSTAAGFREDNVTFHDLTGLREDLRQLSYVCSSPPNKQKLHIACLHYLHQLTQGASKWAHLAAEVKKSLEEGRPIVLNDDGTEVVFARENSPEPDSDHDQPDAASANHAAPQNNQKSKNFADLDDDKVAWS